MKNKEKIDDTAILGTLREYYDLCKSAYAKIHRKMRVLDQTDSGELWKALGTKFPKYQILPDTNYVAYVKSNLAASIYTVEKSAEVQPTSDKDKEIITHLNVALGQIWNTCKVGDYQFLAGENAALHNVGITQVGWSEDKKDGGDSKGGVVLENINPIKFMRDPSAKDLDNAAYCMTYDKYHKTVFLNDKKYKEAFQKYLASNQGSGPMNIPELVDDKASKVDKDYYTLVIFWVKQDDGSINEYHTVNGEYMLHSKTDIKPSMFPFADLYCNPPGDKLVGISECMKIFANNTAYNLMDSITLTAEYKNQRPPKFINSQSGLNVASFSKHGDEADRTFIVNGEAQRAVYYHQFPQPSNNLATTQQRLQYGIQNITGVDDRYTGRDTGSVITTGGVEEMLNRVTVSDTPKIRMYEAYTKKLTELILRNYLEFAPKRKYFYKKPDSTKWSTEEVDFPKISADTLFNYQINISSELPNNKQRIAQMANMLMEKQMQYREQGGGGVELITEEEWLMFQDLPNKEYMLERMGIQRLESNVEKVSQVLFQYTDLVKRGMDPNEAVLATANTLSQPQGQMDMGPVPGAMPDGALPPEQAPLPMM